MALHINPAIESVLDPPTGETRGWLATGPRACDLPVIDAAQAVPSYPPAPALREHVAQYVLQPESAFYTPILGLEALRTALADDLSVQYGGKIASDSVGITSGGNHAFCTALLALAGPGDEVILPEPFYFNHQMWLEMQGIGVQCLKCLETEEGMVPDVDAARSLITPHTRAIVLVTPNNPTGTIYKKARIQSFYELARDNGLALVIDETYKDFLPGGMAPHALFEESEWREVFVQLYSFSKVYSLTGYRVGAIVAGERVMEAVSKIADTMTICAPRAGQEAALFGLTALKDWRQSKNDELQGRIARLGQAFEQHDPAFALVSCGAFFAYLRHPFRGMASRDVSKRLFDELSLLTWPGSYFGSDQEDYVRLAFANADDDDIEEMIRRLASMSA